MKKPKKMLKLLKNGDHDKFEDESNKISNDFTPDEAMAIQLIGARKKKCPKAEEESESDGDDEEQNDAGDDE